MRNTIIMLLVAFVIAGCPTHIVSTDERSVVVESQALKADEAQKLANAECAKNKQVAKMTSKAGYWDRNYVFECIPSDIFSSKTDVLDTENKTTFQQTPSNKNDVVDTANKTTPQQSPSSKTDLIDTANKTTPQRFRDLQILKNEGLISDEEYQQKRKQLLERL